MNRSLWIAFSFTAAIVLWLWSGQGSDAASTSEEPVSQAPVVSATKVQVKVSTATELARQLQFQGVILPWRTVELKAQTKGSITGIYVDKGDRVAATDKLLQLDLSDRLAIREQALAEQAMRKADLEANLKLQARAMLSENKVREDRALLAAATAQLQQIDTDIAHTTLLAPFGGRIEQRMVEQGDFVQEGDSVLTVVDDSRLKLSFYVPQQQISKIRLGQQVSASLVSGGQVVGVIRYIAQGAESATRSFLVEAEVSSPSAAELRGISLNQSASLSLTLGTERAHFISPGLLNLASDGSLYVKVMTADKRVASFTVTLVQSEPTGFWVSGLPEQITVIVTGQGFVAAGDLVEPSYDEASSVTQKPATEPKGAQG